MCLIKMTKKELVVFGMSADDACVFCNTWVYWQLFDAIVFGNDAISLPYTVVVEQALKSRCNCRKCHFRFAEELRS